MIIPCKSCQLTFRVDSKLVKPSGSKVRCSNCRDVFKVFPPDWVDRRKHKRLKTRNVIYHTSYDIRGRVISQGLSKAIGISKGGMTALYHKRSLCRNPEQTRTLLPGQRLASMALPMLVSPPGRLLDTRPVGRARCLWSCFCR